MRSIALQFESEEAVIDSNVMNLEIVLGLNQQSNIYA